MKMSNFQLVFIGAFILFIILGVGSFALLQKSGGTSVGSVTIWGTMDNNTMVQVLQTMRSQDKSFQNVVYIQKNSTTYESDLINAMAAGTPPDLFLISQEQLGTFADKIDVIPYSDVSQATFVNSYVPEAQVFLTSGGFLALPFSIDPLVMYYNTDLLTTAGIAQPPQYWSDFLNIAPKITALDTSQNIQTSAVALGAWQNIPNAKAILSALIMQAGDPIVEMNAAGVFTPTLGITPPRAPENPAASALQFYTEFADPSKTSYSWNASLPSAPDAFVSGNLAVYLGFASEYQGLVARNPNLHIGVAQFPQIKGNSTHLTYGNIYGFAIPHSAANSQGALTIAEKLTSQTAIAALSQLSILPPIRTDISLNTQGNLAAEVFGQSALLARGWLDPSETGTNAIFQSMVGSVVSGADTPEQAVSNASQSMQVLFSAQ